jgi:uncharacterized protein (TIGR02246 family)
MQRLLAAMASIVLVTPLVSFAQDAPAPKQKPEQEVRKLLGVLEDAFNRGDARAVAACWTTGGDFTGRTGQRVEGRDNIEKAFQQFFTARTNSTLNMHVMTLRMADPTLALADVLAEVKPAAARLGGEPVLSLVMVKRGDTWLIESARETPNREPPQAEHLKALEWLVGDWAGEAGQGGVSLSSTCGWTDNRSFLIRKFKVESKAGIAHAGTEIIGWDPRAKRIRSWIFDSGGGFGENLWVQDGNRWLIKYSGALADGSEVSATNVLTVVDANTITLQSKDRTANGERQPDVPELTLKRQATAAQPAATAPAPPATPAAPAAPKRPTE